MSFSFSFDAVDRRDALDKLHHVSAPASVKAIVEKAFDFLLRAKPPVSGSGASARERGLRGVIVEAWGHIDDSGTGESKIERLSVRPVWA